jgi:NitT/TauT family transport system ATP-binding protein
LSGGLKQLVAIARATVYDPKLLILDEPFSALDYSLSRMLWIRFREFWANQNVTTIFVSHNIDEAVFLGDRVVVLSARPAKVVADIPVPFGQERSLSLLASPEFFSTRNQILQAFEEGRRG